MITLPLAIRGAPVIVYIESSGTVIVDQASSPVSASMAISRPSSVAEITLPR